MRTIKKHISVTFMIIFFSSSSYAQITREQSDEIIVKYISEEESLRTDYLLLYTTDKLTNPEDTEGCITITNSNNETFSIAYPCWIYHINEWFDVNGPYFRRYLFVNKVDGNLLEIKTRNDFGPSDLENWQLMYSTITETQNINYKPEVLYYPNPVRDYLVITCNKDFGYIEIYDIQGKKVFQETKQDNSIQKFNIASLYKGFYIVNVFDISKNIMSFKILKI